MADTVSKPGFGDARLAEKVIEAYAEGVPVDVQIRPDHLSYKISLTSDECNDIGIDEDRCENLIIETSHYPPIGEEGRANLAAGGFSNEFIDAYAGPDGLRAASARVKWVSEHCGRGFWGILGASAEDRAAMMNDLSSLALYSSPAIPKLLDVLKDRSDDNTARRAASRTLGRIGESGNIGNAVKIIPNLLKVIEDRSEDYTLRQSAAYDLGLFGENAAEALPRLIRIFREHADNFYIRAAIASSILNICPSSDTKSALLVEALDDTDPSVASAVARNLQFGDTSSPEVVSKLIEKLSDTGKEFGKSAMAAEAANALGRIGPLTPEVIPALIRATAHPDIHVARTAAGAIVLIGPSASEAIPALCRLTLSDDSQLANMAIIALGTVGIENEEAITAVFEFGVSGKFNYGNVINALMRMGSRVMVVLIDNLKSATPERRNAAARILGFLALDGFKTRYAIPSLQIMTEVDPDPMCRDMAKWTLEMIQKNIP